MAQCHEMKKGDVYCCLECGIALQVTQECRDASQDECGCKPSTDDCTFLCCGKELVKQ
jgi:hypothetical protein